MTNSRAGFAAAATFAIFIFMGFTTGALGQSAASGKIQSGSAGLSRTFLSQMSVSQTSISRMSAGLLMLALEPDRDRRHREPTAPNREPAPSNGCGNNNGGWDQHGKCSAVPEGGTAFGYLGIVGLCCVATAIFGIRRQARVRVTK
jgi:hypothetical protein